MAKALITVTTPTYNRAHTLPACYESLLKQSDQRFVWMIVDDGSKDETECLVRNWIAENRIDIRYQKKENGGKASALNIGIDLIDTPYAVCLDSDDVFFPNTISSALKLLEKAKDDARSCGILALRNNPDGSVMGKKEIPASMKTVTAVDIFLKLELNTELICFYRTEVLKKYKFPEYEGEKFVSPAWMQYIITQDYYYYTSWDKLCCCEYVEDGLTKNKKKVIMKNPRGYTAVKKLSFNYSTSIKLLIKHGIMYDCGCLIGNEKEWLKGIKHKGWAVVLMPLAFIVKKMRFS